MKTLLSASLAKGFIALTLIIILSLLSNKPAFADDDDNKKFSVIVVTNVDNDIAKLTKQKLRLIFMGGGLSRKYKAINFPSGNPARIDFNTKIVGLTESRIQSYWAQMKFTGRAKPPKELSSSNKIINYLSKHKGAIAYLPASTLIPSQLKIIYP